MKITENKKGRCTGCCAAALFAGFDRTLDFFLVAPAFSASGGKRCQKPLDKRLPGGVLYKKSRLRKKSNGGVPKKDCEVDSYV